jgi:thiamine kinase
VTVRRKQILTELSSSAKFSGELVLNSIPGGSINKSYILENQDQKYFLKTFEMNHFVPTDRQALFFLQDQLADQQKASKPYYLAKNHDFQVEQWVEHTSLANCDLNRDSKIKHLAKNLFEIHQLPVYAVSIDFPDDWRMYMEMAGIVADEKLLERLEVCKQTWLDSHHHDQVLCHNDLAMEHISMCTPSVIFDWEYAACGSRFFDIAACAKINKLSAEESHLLQVLYSQVSGLSEQEVISETEDQVPLVKLTNELWYAAAKVCRRKTLRS